MAPARPSVRKPAAAWLAQWQLLSTWTLDLPPDRWGDPSGLPGWMVGDLVAHLVVGAQTLVDALGAPSDARPTSLADYLSGYEPASAQIAERSRRAAEHGRDGVLADWARVGAAAETACGEVPDGADPVVVGPRGPLRLSDFLATRCLELVVHGDDLARALPGGPPLDRDALGVVCRALTRVVAERSPGRSVELRVPPFAAVQCVAGPTHRRGTPPAVVELAPLPFVRLATGRLAWEQAVGDGQVRSSGLRADLSGLLPVLR